MSTRREARRHAKVTMRQFQMGKYTGVAFNGAEVPPTGPNGDRGSSLVVRDDGAFWLTAEGTSGTDGKLYGMAMGDVPGVADELARKFAQAVSASAGALLGEERGASSRRVVFGWVENPQATSLDLSSGRSERFAKAAAAAMPGSVLMNLVPHAALNAEAAAAAPQRRGAAPRYEPGSLFVDTACLATIKATDLVLIVAEDGHAPLRAALGLLALEGLQAKGITAFRNVDGKYPYATSSLLDADTRAWRFPASAAARRDDARRAARGNVSREIFGSPLLASDAFNIESNCSQPAQV